MSIWETILDQLGGSRFQAMTGARNFVYNPSSLQFDLPRGSAKVKGKGVSKVKVSLEPSDTYKIELYQYLSAKLELIPLAEESGIYIESLQARFTSLTGLDTHF